MGVEAEPEALAGPGKTETGKNSQDQGRVAFQLRIGVTGDQDLSLDDARLREAVKDAIRLAIRTSGYPERGPRRTPLRLTVVSALAEGADHIAADTVLNYTERPVEGTNLVCVLPVRKEQLGLYRGDFTLEKSRQEFDRLLGRAWQLIEAPANLVPANATQEQRNDGYRWAAQEVVRGCDVLIAIWDGKSVHGKGDTAGLMNWARQRDLDRSRPEPSLEMSEGPALRALASALLDSPLPEETVFDVPWPLRIIVDTSADLVPVIDDGPPWDIAAAAVKRRLKADLAGLDEFNHRNFKGRWRPSVEKAKDDLVPVRYRQSSRLKAIVEQIGPHLNRADQAAISAQRNFVRFSYALFGFTALATIIAAAQAVVFPGAWWLAYVELALIIGSAAIVYLENLWRNNNKHWFVYRFYAERLRTASYLLAVGSIPEIEFDVGGTAEDPAGNDWVRRAFAAALAECDLRHQQVSEDPETLSSLIRVHWMGGQLKYFERTSKKMIRKHRMVRRSLNGVLIATIIAALLHGLRIWPLHSSDTQALVMCAIGLPAVAGVLTNVRSIREFSRHSFRYARMAAILRRYMERFNNETDIDELRELAEKVGEVLTAETKGWLVEVSGRGLEIHG